MPVDVVKRTWFDISAPWSQVMERHSSSGSVVMALRMALSTLSADRPSVRCKSSTSLVERSTRVPTALRPPFAQDEVAFPVAGDGSVDGFGRSLGDHDHARNPSPLLDPASGLACRSSRAQASGQLTAEFASALDEQGLVDRLVAHPHLRVVREVQR